MPVFNQESLERRVTLHPSLQLVLDEAIGFMEFKILVGHIDVAEGESKPRCPSGSHNNLPSTAADVAPLVLKEQYDPDDLRVFKRLIDVIQACAKRHGVRLRFGLGRDAQNLAEEILDAAHIELDL